MPQLNGTGPDKKGKKTGRGLGQCHEAPSSDNIEQLGKGMGLRRQSGGGEGLGERRKAGLNIILK